jgi:LacI family gluconate utilization system Gnt-I transcriptional repressor
MRHPAGCPVLETTLSLCPIGDGLRGEGAPDRKDRLARACRQVGHLSTRRRRQRQERVTLEDVALAANVSSITVSRALRNPEKVTPELRDRILRHVADMGYVPDFAARALASRTSGMIGVLSPSLANYAFISVMRGIEDRVGMTDLRIQYANTGFEPDEQVKQLRLFLSQNPVGLIVVSGVESPQLLDILAQAPCPIVQALDIASAPIGMAIGIDNRIASETATRHLIERGYRRIALFSGGPAIHAYPRLAGYRAVMEEAGLFDPTLVVQHQGHSSVSLGGHLIDRLFRQAPDADAAFCLCDDVALGAIFECQRRGIRVPEDFGICGYHDLDFASVSVPTITTVRVPRYDIGFRAADKLLRAVAGGKTVSSVVDVGFQLVERETTARRSER